MHFCHHLNYFCIKRYLTMSKSYTQNNVHFVFSVKKRKCLIFEPLKSEIEKYICGIISEYKCIPHAIYCNPDHIHILVNVHRTLSLSDLAKIIKANSSKFINKHHKLPCYFSWQVGYGAFSYSHSHIERVNRYIRNQANHHRNKNYQDEYIRFLNKFEIPYELCDLFD